MSNEPLENDSTRGVLPDADQGGAGTLPKFSRILVPVDFSESSLKSVDYAASLAGHFNSTVFLLFVGENAPTPGNFEKTLIAVPDNFVNAQAHQKLVELARQRLSPVTPAFPEVRFGRPYQVIAETAGILGVDLIVLSTHGRTGIAHALLGSTAERVVRHAPCPVLVVRQRERDFVEPVGTGAAPAPIEPPPLGLKVVLVPYDFSDYASKSLDRALCFARLTQARVVLLHVVEPHVYPENYFVIPADMEEVNIRMIAEAKERLQDVIRSRAEAGLAMEGVVRVGRSYTEIVDGARELKADLLVIGTHGYTGLKHVLMGSTAERVVRQATCPVLVARHP